MNDYSIKISELDPIYSASIETEDFFPLVHSQSMTTYRATLEAIGQLMTHSIYADTASWTPAAISSSHADNADSASYALSASYAISASHARLADSASYYPPQQFQISCSWASRSLQTWYATRSIDVDTYGTRYNFPFWNTNNVPGVNGALNQRSPIVYYPYSGQTGLMTFDSASTDLVSYYPDAVKRPDYQVWVAGDRANVAWGFAPNLGIQSHWPITSHTFVGTDQRGWYFTTSSNPHAGFDPDLQVTNSYYSGSAGDASSGSFYTIPEAPGALASIFNGKWVRLVSYGANPAYSTGGGKFTADHSAMGEVWGIADQVMKGLISIQVQTTVHTGGSNSWNQVDLYVHSGDWSGNQSATVLHVHNYGRQLIRAFRISTKGGGIVDPPYTIDMLIDGLYAGGETPGGQGEPVMNVIAQSWQGIRFLKWLNVDPWPFETTGSNDITQDGTQLIFPAAPGYYSNSPKSMNYNIQGKNVVIWPNANQITQSGLAVPAIASTQSLFVSGGINTNTSFYCDNNQGLTTKVNYGSNNLYFSGGILIRKEPPDGYVPPPTTVPMVVIQICNSNSAIDDEYNVYLNGNYIGYYDGGANTLMNSVFYGNSGDTVNVASLNALSLTCNDATSLANRTYYRFPASYVINGNNVLRMVSAVNTGGASDVGSVIVLKTSLTGGNVTLTSVLLSTSYNGAAGGSFTFNFTYS